MTNPDEVARALDLLELDENASIEAIVARRREIATRTHPDRGGSHEAMVAVNRATDVLLRWRQIPTGVEADTRGSPDPASRGRTTVRLGDLRVDRPSFVIEALPVVAHESLLLAAGVLGQLCDDDPPYVIETLIAVDESMPGLAALDRAEVWCRLELVPDAGSTTVSIVSDVDPGLLVNLWCDTVNELGLAD